MPAVHLSGRQRRQAQQQASQQQYPSTGVTQPGIAHQAINAPVVVVGLSLGEKVSSVLINGGIILIMDLVLYFGWNFGLLGIGGIIRQDLYHWGPYFVINRYYDLNLGLHHIIPLIVSLIEWHLMPYEKVAPFWYFRISLRHWEDNIVFGIGGKQGDAAKTPLQKWVWWINLILLDVGTTYGGVAVFYAAGVVLPLPGITLMLATVGIALVIQATITAVLFALLPEPVIKKAWNQLMQDFGR